MDTKLANSGDSASGRIICIHGTAGHPCIHWFPWLREQLEELGREVLVPWFPTPEGQHVDTWFSVFNEEVGEVRPADVLVGHSVGACFLLRVLERLIQPVRSVHLVAGFHTALPDEEINALIRSFVYKPFDWEKIQQGAQEIQMYHGDDDPYVPLPIARELSENLHSSLAVLKGGGHLNTDSGYSEFPQLLNSILNPL